MWLAMLASVVLTLCAAVMAERVPPEACQRIPIWLALGIVPYS
jgi:hypothetical protein